MANLERMHAGYPDRPVVVFIHGLGGHMFNWMSFEDSSWEPFDESALLVVNPLIGISDPAVQARIAAWLADTSVDTRADTQDAAE